MSKRIFVVILSVIMMICCSACGADGRTYVIETKDAGVTAGEYAVFLREQQSETYSLYKNMYIQSESSDPNSELSDFWSASMDQDKTTDLSSDGTTLYKVPGTIGEKFQVDSVKTFVRYLVAREKSALYGISLSDAQLHAIHDAAVQYMESNEKSMLQANGILEEDVEQYLMDSTYYKLLTEKLTNEYLVKTEVPKVVSLVMVSDTSVEGSSSDELIIQKMRKALDDCKLKSDLSLDAVETISSTYNAVSVQQVSLDLADKDTLKLAGLTQRDVNVLNQVDNGKVYDQVLKTESGAYYFLVVLENPDEAASQDLWQSNARAQVSTQMDSWAAELSTRIDAETLAKITVDDMTIYKDKSMDSGVGNDAEQ